MQAGTLAVAVLVVIRVWVMEAPVRRRLAVVVAVARLVVVVVVLVPITRDTAVPATLVPAAVVVAVARAVARVALVLE
jgi:hypothetical protein